MSYPDTDIFLLAYNMTRNCSMVNIGSWMAELVQHCESDFHIILVGTKADLWEELMAHGTPDQQAQLTTWQQGYDVPAASHLRFDAFT